MDFDKAAKKFVNKVTENCKHGILHPQVQYDLEKELVSLLKAVQAETRQEEMVGDSASQRDWGYGGT